MDWKKQLPRISAERFTHEISAKAQYIGHDEVFDKYAQNAIGGWTPLGWAPNSALHRQCEEFGGAGDYIAVLFESEEGDKCWFHLYYHPGEEDV
ncbi:MAG: hypothetical protein KAI66_27705 [Lentisphaeria bacterium]|nr:hypothetical protein [Lentisphaeria bacterium]